MSILVVDDERITCAFLAKTLSMNSWHVDTACDGPSALDLVRRNQYDAIVLDYRMPGMNGADLSLLIEEVSPGIPRVLLTGYPTIDTVFPAVNAGVDRVLAKPIDPQELIESLEDQIAEHPARTSDGGFASRGRVAG
jgi:DNA-binding NtrC family response regulator